MKDIQCPYCQALQDIDHDDGYGYEEGVVYQQQCSDCEKNFTYTTGLLYVYEPEKADCLNDGEHDYKLAHTIPREFSKMRCTMCDHKRQLTPEEKAELLKVLS